MAKQGLLLLVHSEVTDPEVDIFDREAAYIERNLRPLVKAIPELKVVMEHVTTRDAVEFVKACGANVAATITAHHLLYNRNRIFLGGLNPHYYCLPVLKAEEHRKALVAAAASGSPKFFAGTDSAPHVRGAKETGCGCAGCYTAHAAVELYTEALAKVSASLSVCLSVCLFVCLSVCLIIFLSICLSIALAGWFAVHFIFYIMATSRRGRSSIWMLSCRRTARDSTGCHQTKGPPLAW
jgi:dihydroorotase (homodimeric type)